MQTDKNELLNQAKELLKEEMTQIAYDTWLKTLEIVEFTDDHIVFKASSEYHRDLINTRYADLILNTFKNFNSFSKPLFKSVGFVVNVINDDISKIIIILKIIKLDDIRLSL